ncbi:TetR/AcrR family transcriptional regulator, partial [Amycolatopsis sp. NPDC000673]|uniref:TetR/AcrR family transcriptional regulator n=1 Tax=Amycolatopsis sp. NPDC000673 TaxID=3154267 RepID=UPI00331BEE1B
MARPRTFDEKQVLNAVRDQFWDAGYAATSLEDLMRVSGLGKGSLYAAFGDKRQLFLRALRSYTDDQHDALRKALSETPRSLRVPLTNFHPTAADAPTQGSHTPPHPDTKP